MKHKLKGHFSNKSNILLWVMFGSFFLPWISYGYISQSGFEIPSFLQTLKATANIFAKEKIDFGGKLYYAYALYLFPAMTLITLFFLKQRVVRIFVAIIPIIIFGVGFFVAKVTMVDYIGLGIYSFLLAAVALFFVEFTTNKHPINENSEINEEDQ